VSLHNHIQKQRESWAEQGLVPTTKDKTEPHYPHDVINHPKHYVSDPSGVECIQITEHRNFTIGNAIKYLWRAGLKDGSSNVQDLKKAIWYINREIDRIERNG